MSQFVEALRSLNPFGNKDKTVQQVDSGKGHKEKAGHRHKNYLANLRFLKDKGLLDALTDISTESQSYNSLVLVVYSPAARVTLAWYDNGDDYGRNVIVEPHLKDDSLSINGSEEKILRGDEINKEAIKESIRTAMQNPSRFGQYKFGADGRTAPAVLFTKEGDQIDSVILASQWPELSVA